MASDLEIIEQIEKENWIKLHLSDKAPDKLPAGSYVMDISRRITHLSLSRIELFNYSFVKEFKNLTELNLSGTKITDGSFLKDLKNLTHLNLNGTKITDWSFLKDLKNLTHLYLIAANIADGSFLKNLKNLTKLNLSRTKITDGSFLKDLKNLTELYLSGTKITDWSFLKDLKNLTELYLSSTEITDWSFLKDLKNLRSVDLRNNKIVYLPREIAQLGLPIDYSKYGSRHSISLFGNPLENPPIEIVKRGHLAIIEYFKSIEGEKQSLNEVKVLLVGDGGAGKTSLIKRILGEGFNLHELQTDGININQWETNDGQCQIRVHFWDFGGQEIMHATHQFFLSRRSLYVLVLDSRKDEKTEYWLKHIESFGGNSPILVVINKIDQNPGFDVNRKFLLDKYKNIKGFSRISCATNEGVENFKKKLISVLSIVELRQTVWPKNWFNVKNHLEQITNDFISFDEYRNICIKENIKDTSAQNILVDYLNDLGVVLHFSDFELLDTHVLEPKWVTEAVYKIINSEELARNKGILKIAQLDVILKQQKEGDYYYPPDRYRFIIDLMMKFELCYKIDYDTVLIPDLLEIQELDVDFNYRDSLNFIIQYDFLPKSVMPRFIVRMHKDIKDNLRWRTGLVLTDKTLNSTAIVKADEKDNKIFIYVTGDQRRDYFSYIRKTLRDINSSFEKMVAEELIPLPDADNHTVKYTELIGHELTNRKEYFCGELQRLYSVEALLNGVERPTERNQLWEEFKRTGEIHLHYNPSFSPQIEQKQQVSQSTDIDLKVDMKIELRKVLPDIQCEFDELKDLLSKVLPEKAYKVEQISSDLDGVTSESDKKEINSVLNKTGRLLRNIGDEKSELNKKLKGLEKGTEYIKKGVNLYNKIAPFIGWPPIPWIS